jgi:predicted anti-sigma-YlaC factor YlaD
MNAPEMGCHEVVQVVTDYLEGKLAAADMARFEAHLEECSGCRMYLDQMRETITALGHLPPESLSPEAEMRLLAAFRGWRQARP